MIRAVYFVLSRSQLLHVSKDVHRVRLVGKDGRDQVVPVLGLLQTTEGHLGARNVFLGVLEVFELMRVRTCSRISPVQGE